MKVKSAALVLGLALASSGLKAADAPAWYTNTTVHGFVDANYEYNFNGLAPVGRVFDTTDQTFLVNGAKLAIANADKASGTSGEIDLLYGPMAAVYNSGNIFTASPVSASSSSLSSLAIEQAFLTQAMGPVTFKLGKSGTFVGNEVTDTTGNFNYSRSLLFGQEPFYNTGLSATYGITSTLSLMGYIGDGNSVDVGTADHPDFGAQIVYTGVKGLSLTGTYYLQPVGPVNYGSTATPPVGFTEYTNIDLFNFIVSYQITDPLAFVGEYLYKTQVLPSDASTSFSTSQDSQGYALYLDYQTPVAGLKIDPRFEQWFAGSSSSVNSTFSGINSVTQFQLNEFTLTLKYAMGPVTNYLEYRVDGNPSAPYAQGADTSKTLVNAQNTLTYAATYSF
jgi:hypothetical protein